MSDLRNQLDALKSEYRSQRYPGDLATELLQPPSARPIIFRIGAFATVAAAIAAAIVLWLGHRLIVPTGIQPPVQVATTTRPQDDQSVPVADVPAMLSAFPEDLPLTPSTSGIEMPPMPAVPSMGFDFTNNTSDTKEST